MSLSKLFCFTVVLFALLGQSVSAAVMSCQAHGEQGQHAYSTMMPNSTMHTEHAMATAANHDDMQCCQDECACPITGCHANASLFGAIELLTLSYSHDKISLYQAPELAKLSSSLYRPPILTA